MLLLKKMFDLELGLSSMLPVYERSLQNIRGNFDCLLFSNVVNRVCPCFS